MEHFGQSELPELIDPPQNATTMPASVVDAEGRVTSADVVVHHVKPFFKPIIRDVPDSLPMTDEDDESNTTDWSLTQHTARTLSVPGSGGGSVKRAADNFNDDVTDGSKKKRLNFTNATSTQTSNASARGGAKLNIVVNKFLYADVKHTVEHTVAEVKHIIKEHGGSSHVLLRQSVHTFPVELGMARTALLFGIRSRASKGGRFLCRCLPPFFPHQKTSCLPRGGP